MASLWTGLYPERTGVLRHADAVSPHASMPAEVFREAGFLPIGIWRNGWVAPNFGFRQGFEIYQNPLAVQSPDSVRRLARYTGKCRLMVLKTISLLLPDGLIPWGVFLPAPTDNSIPY